MKVAVNEDICGARGAEDGIDPVALAEHGVALLALTHRPKR